MTFGFTSPVYIAILPKVLAGPTDACAVILVGSGGGDTFDCYALQDPITGTLNHGRGFSSAWAFGGIAYGILGNDTFETYTVGTNVSNLNAGYGFSNPWVVQDNQFGFSPSSSGSDTFENYADQTITANVLTSGTGWIGPFYFDSVVGNTFGQDTFETYGTGSIYNGSLVYQGRYNLSNQVPNWNGAVTADEIRLHLYGNGFQGNAVMDAAGQQLYLYLERYGYAYSSQFQVTAGSNTVLLKTCGNGTDTSTVRVIVATWQENPYYAMLYPNGTLSGGVVLDTTVYTGSASVIQTNQIDFLAPTTGTKYFAVYGTYESSLYPLSGRGGCYIDDIVLIQNGTGTVYNQNFNNGNPYSIGGLNDGSGYYGPWYCGTI